MGPARVLIRDVWWLTRDVDRGAFAGAAKQ